MGGAVDERARATRGRNPPDGGGAPGAPAIRLRPPLRAGRASPAAARGRARAALRRGGAGTPAQDSPPARGPGIEPVRGGGRAAAAGRDPGAAGGAGATRGWVDVDG